MNKVRDEVKELDKNSIRSGKGRGKGREGRGREVNSDAQSEQGR